MRREDVDWAAIALCALVIICAISGCASTAAYTRTPRPCQAQAVDLVWRGVYGRTDPPPDVWWVPPADQDCGRTVNGARGTKLGDTCAGGYTVGDNINLIWFGAWPLTALAHELAHVVDARAGRPGDFAHAGPMFQRDGAVEKANQALAAMRCAP